MAGVLLISTALTASLVVATHAVVFADILGVFPSPSSQATTGFVDSPYWLNVPRDTIVGIGFLQLVAAAGFIAWMTWLAERGAQIVESSILSTLAERVILIQAVLWPAAVWPVACYGFLLNPSMKRALVACLPLWISAFATTVLISGTFEAKAPCLPTVGILVFGNVAILVNGVGWSTVCLRMPAC